jgi:hypothetical protein
MRTRTSRACRKNLQMLLRDRRRTEIEAARDFAGSKLALGEYLDDLPARGVCKCRKTEDATI